MSEIKRCPFCGAEEMYETKRENELGTIIPQLFCNCCKMTVEIENDSPYFDDDKTYEYLKEKLYVWWNTRIPMQNIVERLEHFNEETFYRANGRANGKTLAYGYSQGIRKAIEIVKEEGGAIV